MKRYRLKTWPQRHGTDLEDLFEQVLRGSDYDYGEAGAAQGTATNNSEALGRLVQLLLDAEALNLEQVNYILGNRLTGAESVQED